MANKTTRAWFKRVRTLVSAHHELVYRVAYRVASNRADAEDIAQTVFMKLLTDERMLDGVVNERAWLAKVTINAATTELRSTQRRRGREREWLERRLANQSITRHGDEMQNNETRELIDDAISALPDELRIPIELHYQEGFKYREIADVCGCPEGTVAQRISRAKEKLRERLAPSGALAAFPGIEAALRSVAPIPVPAGLETSLLRGLDSAFAGLGGGTATATAAAASASTAAGAAGAKATVVTAGSIGLVTKLAAAFLLSGAIATGAWFAMDSETSRGVPSGETAVADTPATPNPANSPIVDSAPSGSPVRGLSRVASAAPETESTTEEAAAEAEESATTIVVRGRVLDDDGNPVPGARVSIANAALGSGEGTETDEEGRYELSLGNTEFAAAMTTAAFSPDGQTLAVQIDEGAGDIDRDIIADIAEAESRAQLAEVESRRQIEEQALARMQLDLGMVPEIALEAVELVEAPADPTASQLRVLAENVAAQSVILREMEAQRAAVSYDLAIQRITALSGLGTAGGRRVLVLADGFEAAWSEPIDIDTSSPEERVIDFELRPSRRLSGGVFSETGRPIAGASVSILGHASGELVPPETSTTTTGEDGAFSFPTLGPGTYALGVSAPGHVAVDRVVHATETRVVIQLPLAARVEARVVRRGSLEPLDGFVVELLRPEDGSIVTSSYSEDDGIAEIDGIAPGRYFLNAYRAKSESEITRAWTEIAVRAGETVEPELVVAHRVDLNGSIPLDVDVPSAAKRIRVTVGRQDLPWRADAASRTKTPDEDGAFRFRSLPPGTYALHVERDGVRVSELAIELLADMPETFVSVPLDALEPSEAPEPAVAEALPAPAVDLGELFDADARITVLSAMRLSTYLDLVAALPLPRLRIGESVRASDLEVRTASPGTASPAEGLAYALHAANLRVVEGARGPTIERVPD